MTELVSVDRDTSCYDTLKSLVNTDRFDCVRHDHLLSEFKRLELVKGKKVDHPPKGSKDCADAVVGVCKTILEMFDVKTEEEIIYNDDSTHVQIEDHI